MTNKTNKTEPEMPIKIFTPPVKNPDGYYLADEMNAPGDVSYTRTDTIPSRAEVAREFYEAANKLAGEKMQHTGVMTGAHFAAMQQVLKEWEDAEKRI